MLVGDQSGLDPSLRPMWPSLFVSDISTDPSNRSGDWQQGNNSPATPNDVYGTWKAITSQTIDQTTNPATFTIVKENDPAANHWNLGVGADPVPAGLTDQGYGAEVVWTASGLGLQSGHVYRLEFMVHDGDQNKTGGDVGEACVNMFIP